MSIIRQGSLFDLQDLYDLEPTQRYDAILSVVDTDVIYQKIKKKSFKGTSVKLNYGAMINSLIIRISERIPTVKDLIKRLRDDFIFKLNCGFLVSDHTPSESAFSRLISKLDESNVLEVAKEKVVLQANSEGFINDEACATDSTHFEARDQAPPKEEKPVKTPN